MASKTEKLQMLRDEVAKGKNLSHWHLDDFFVSWWDAFHIDLQLARTDFQGLADQLVKEGLLEPAVRVAEGVVWFNTSPELCL